VTLRSLLRRAYGVRMRMIHERTAIWGDGEKLDGQVFCWTGQMGKKSQTMRDGPRESDHIVNVLTAQFVREGFNLERALETYRQWTEGKENEPK